MSSMVFYYSCFSVFPNDFDNSGDTIRRCQYLKGGEIKLLCNSSQLPFNNCIGNINACSSLLISCFCNCESLIILTAYPIIYIHEQTQSNSYAEGEESSARSVSQSRLHQQNCHRVNQLAKLQIDHPNHESAQSQTESSTVGGNRSTTERK